MLFSIASLKLLAFFVLLPLVSDLAMANFAEKFAGAVAGVVGKDHPIWEFAMAAGFDFSNKTEDLLNLSMTATPKINGGPTTATDPMETCADDGSLFDSALGGTVTALLIILLWHIVRICCCMSKSKPPPPPPPPSRAPPTAAKSGTNLVSGSASVRSQSINLKSTRSVRGTGATISA
ncbi:hypothetical protein ACQ4LE_008226 [Meloidogyne hapla]|uniref:Secreted protein n=1 Tax=Meloidogyne hapla TaxID=6305 RepID=A0A1I8B6W9_MELHA